MDRTARIIVIDDDESIGKTLSTILEDEGCFVARYFDTSRDYSFLQEERG